MRGKICSLTEHAYYFYAIVHNVKTAMVQVLLTLPGPNIVGSGRVGALRIGCDTFG